MKLTGLEAILKLLENRGVKFIFLANELPKPNFIPILNCNLPKIVYGANGTSAIFMANSYFRITGEIGISFILSNTQLIESLPAILSSLYDSIPLLIFIFINKGEGERLSHSFDGKLHTILRQYVKKIIQLKNYQTIEELIKIAFQTAKEGEPGPVIVEIPNYFLSKSVYIDLTSHKDKKEIDLEIPEEKIKIIASILKESKRVGIYAGMGCMDASENLLELAQILQAPVATTISGRGLIPEEHPLSVGLGFGYLGSYIADEALKICDTILAIGCKFKELNDIKIRKPKKLIHVDTSGEVLGGNIKADITLRLEASIFIKEIINQFKDYNRAKVDLSKLKSDASININKLPTSSEFVSPYLFINKLRESLPKDAIITIDSGFHQPWFLPPNFPVYEKRTFITTTSLETKGFAIPSAISSKYIKPEKKVLAIVDPISLLLNISELLIALYQGIGITCIIFNDNHKELLKEIYFKEYKINLPFLYPQSIDYKKISELLPCAYVTIKNDQEIEYALKEVLSLNELAILEVKVGYDIFKKSLKEINYEEFNLLPNPLKMRFFSRIISRVLKKF